MRVSVYFSRTEKIHANALASKENNEENFGTQSNLRQMVFQKKLQACVSQIHEMVRDLCEILQNPTENIELGESASLFSTFWVGNKNMNPY